MDCNEIRKLIVPHIFGELGREDKVKLLIHRAQCRQCHDDYNELSAAIANNRGKMKCRKLLIVNLRQKIQKHWLHVAIKEASVKSTQIAIRNVAAHERRGSTLAKRPCCAC